MVGPRVLGRFVAAAGVVLLAGCAAKGPGPLYLWESFPRQQYSLLLREGASPAEQIRVLEAHAEKARGANAALPPGFRAHLGLLHLGAGDPQRAKDLWQAERTAFPESAPFMDRLLKRLDGSAPTAKSENPA